MADQAERLRDLMRRTTPAATQRDAAVPAFAARPAGDTAATDCTQVIAVTSGKGGVGKTTITSNLAIALADRHRRVAVLDADLALGNVDIILGLSPRWNLSHVVRGEKTLEEIAIPGPGGITVIPASSGIVDMAQLPHATLLALLAQAEAFGSRFDYLFLDTGAGLTDQVRRFALAADDVIVVTTPEPTAYTDAYAMIKALLMEREQLVPGLVVNGASSRNEAIEAAHNIASVVERFVGAKTQILGYLLRDPDVPQAVRKQIPVLRYSPHGTAATALRALAAYLEQSRAGGPAGGGLRRFFERVLDLIRRPAAARRSQR